MITAITVRVCYYLGPSLNVHSKQMGEISNPPFLNPPFHPGNLPGGPLRTLHHYYYYHYYYHYYIVITLLLHYYSIFSCLLLLSLSLLFRTSSSSTGRRWTTRRRRHGIYYVRLGRYLIVFDPLTFVLDQ